MGDTLVETTVPAIRASSDRMQQWAKVTAAWLLSFSSEHTRIAYQGDVRQWTRWCLEHDLVPLDVTRAHIDGYVRELELDALSASTIARRISSLSSLYGYAEDEALIDRNPVRRVRRPRVSDMSETRWLTVPEMRAFIEAAETSGPKDHLIALLLSLSGLRSGELRSLRIEEVGSYGGYTTILVHGKGGNDLRVPIPDITADILETVIGTRDYGYLIDGGEWRGWSWTDPSTQHPAPVESGDVDMSPWQLTRIVTRLANAAGINAQNPKVSPHSLRHSAITAALDSGVDLRDAEQFARHADPRTTRRYDRSRDNFNRHASHALARAILN